MFQPPVRNEKRIIDRGMMVKDPIDGTYVAATDAYVYKKKGKNYYFSSRENLKKFIRMKNWKDSDGD
jgi:YHS domain-containing protein